MINPNKTGPGIDPSNLVANNKTNISDPETKCKAIVMLLLDVKRPRRRTIRTIMILRKHKRPIKEVQYSPTTITRDFTAMEHH